MLLIDDVVVIASCLDIAGSSGTKARGRIVAGKCIECLHTRSRADRLRRDGESVPPISSLIATMPPKFSRSAR